LRAVAIAKKEKVNSMHEGTIKGITLTPIPIAEVIKKGVKSERLDDCAIKAIATYECSETRD